MSKQVQDAYVVAVQRTPVGKAPRGLLRNTRPDDLLVHAVRGALKKIPQLDPADIQDAIVGCAMPEGEQGLNVGRIVTLLAGLPQSVSGVTINRFCASGLQSIAWAADRIRLGEADVMIGAGMESMSQVPMGGNTPAINPAIFTDENVGIAYGMGMTAEKVADQWKISREAQDQFAIASHQKAVKAIENGWWESEILPITIREQIIQGNTVTETSREMKVDEGPRADSNIAALAKLKPVFAANGSVTAGNSSQTSDGAACAILMSERKMKQLGIEPMARFVGFAVAGVEPKIMGIGPIKAIPAVLQQTGLKIDDMDWIELNEAFAAQSLAIVKELRLNTDKVNPQGGAIALGHPLGATGSIRVATLLHGLKRINGKYGMVSMCIGTGMGAAGIFERI